MDDALKSPVTLYWRPGCRYCTKLRQGLDRLGLKRVEVNIWDDPNGAAVVRGVANGNETVPTVIVDGIGYVNPSPDLIARLVHGQADSSTDRKNTDQSRTSASH